MPTSSANKLPFDLESEILQLYKPHQGQTCFRKNAPGATSQAIVANEVGAWEAERNAVRATIDWRFIIPNAKDKLKKLYLVGEE